MDQDNAFEIYQDILDRLSSAFMALDYPVIFQYIALPHVRRTQHSETIIETTEDLEKGIRLHHQSIRVLGVDSYIRLTTSAEFLAPDYIEGFHDTRALRGAMPMIPRYHNRSVLRRFGGSWKIVEIESNVRNPSWPFAPLRVSEADEPLFHDHRNEKDARRDRIDPVDVLSRFLDALTQSNQADDFDAYCNLVDLPAGFHSAHEDRVLQTRSQLRQVFDMLRATMALSEDARLHRTAIAAEYVSADQIVGYYDSCVLANDAVHYGPVKARVVLKQIDGNWKLKSATNAVRLTDEFSAAPEVVNTLPTELEIKERTKTWPTLR